MKILGVATLLILSASLSTAIAQESLNAAAGNASGMGGKASYSIGQIVYTTNTASTGSAAQGVQQAFEISDVTGLKEAKGISLLVSVYPNPTTDYLTLNITDIVKTSHNLSLLSYQLYDIHGRLLQEEKITDNQTSIFMGNFVPATYFVKVVVNKQGLASQEVKIFKIIKMQ